MARYQPVLGGPAGRYVALSVLVATVAHIIRWVVAIKYELAAEEGESLASDKTRHSILESTYFPLGIVS